MALTDMQIRNAKPAEKQYKLSAGDGLYLIVSPAGGKWWRVRYRYGGKQKELSVGTYPEVKLKEAKQKRDDIRTQLSNEIDPAHERKIKKITRKAASENNFKAVALEWIRKFGTGWTDKYRKMTTSRLELHAFPWIGHRNVNEITPPELLTVLRRVESQGKLETAHRVRKLSSSVFRYAIASGLAERDPAVDLVGALSPNQTKHLASITEPKRVGDLLRAIDAYGGFVYTKCALKLSAMLMLRPVNVRSAEWEHIDLDEARWRIPMGSMKKRRTHIVPLPRQAVEVFREMETMTGRGKYVFPSVRSNKKPMSENTVNSAIRRMGFSSDEMTAHGFRSMASTLLHEQGYNSDWIERQLAHVDGNSVRAAYNYAQYLDDRAEMLQHWADYLDALKAGADVIAINHKVRG